MNGRRQPPVRLSWALIALIALLAAGSAARLAAGAEGAIAPLFDHLTTGFELLGQHRDLACESCHVNAVFKGTPRECSACHGVGTAVRATAKPDNHILSSTRCDACHNTVAWAPAVSFDHVEVRGSCVTCHNNVQAQGMGPKHIQTDLECDVCHSTISWTGAVFNHVGVSAGCASCHNGVQATGLPASGHIPTNGAPCESCHTPGNFTTWTGATMNHAAVSGIPCSSCHEAGKSFTGVTIVTRPPAPHPTTGDCGLCHSSTTSFKSGTLMPANHIPLPAADAGSCALCHSNPTDYSGYAMNHVNIASGCAQCHASGLSFANIAPPVLKELPGNHVPVGSVACESCHAASNFTSFAGTAMNHAGFNSSCIACHGAGLNFITPVKAIPANHIPTGSIACEGCHSKSNFTTFAMPNTGASMNHAVVSSIACSTCHEAGKSFVGAPPIVVRPPPPHVTGLECSTCHFSTTSFLGASNLPVNHIPLPAADNGNCALCHANPNDYSVYTMSHANITGNCAQCHGSGLSFANIAPPVLKELPANHVPVGTVACESCHAAANFTSFAGTAMVHAAVASVACATCHASGKSFVAPVVTEPNNHIPIGTVACESCHSATNFTSFAGTAMNHASFKSTCIACHGAGLSFVGSPAVKTIPANHIPTGSIACEGCHSTSNFTTFAMPNTGASMNHTVVSSIACSTCHEAGKSFVGAPPIVVRPPPPHVATGECSTCHFSTTTFAGATNLPANHIPLPAADNSNCALCHTNANDYSVYAMNHVNIASGCAQCHASGLSFANIAPPALKELPGNHVPVGGAACESCHSATNFSSFAGTAMNHAGFASNCIACHGAGLSFVAPVKAIPANHIPTGTIACEGCHSKSNFTTFSMPNTGASMNHTVVSSIACSTCHEAGKSFVGAPPIVVRPPPPHVTGGECSTCHFSTTTFAGAMNLPANHIPLPAADNSNCALCHTNANDYSVYAMNHVNIASGCAQCHGAGLSFANMAPPTLKEPPSGSPAHIPVKGSIACELCHTATNFTTFAGTIMRHAAVPGQACDSCHEFGMAWYGEPRLWVRDGPDHHAGKDCGGSGCHTARDKLALRPAAAKAGLAVRPQLQALPAADAGNAGAATPGMAGGRLAAGLPAAFNHLRIGNATCASCHNGAAASGKPAGHVATTNDCGSCHTTLSWARVAQVDHMQVLGGCASCHNGRSAIGKPVMHVATSAECGVCHTSNAWTPARFDHSAAGAGIACRRCHDAVHAIGLPAHHLPTAQDCSACHGTLAWTPAKVDHRTLTARCGSCHNNIAATGLTSMHLATTRDCATCHTYPDWNVLLPYRHQSASYPGDHRAALGCVSCHGSNSEQVVYSAPANAGTCGACHARDFKPAAHPRTAKGQLYTGTELRNCSGACHVFADAPSGGITSSRPGPYHRVNDAAFKH